MQDHYSTHVLQQSFKFEEDPAARKKLAYRDRLKMLLTGNLDFHGKNSNYVAHSWHAFPAKFPPQLPELFIRELTEPGEIVFDPMMGSCTTLIESILLNRQALGSDIDPLTLEIGKAKLQPVDALLARSVGKRVLARAQKVYQENPEVLREELGQRFDKETRDFIDYWFKRRTQLELISLLREIESLDNLVLRGLYQLVFSAIIITKSGGVSLARDLAHTRPHKVEKTPNSAFMEFWKRLQRNLQNYYIPPHGAFLQIFESDARILPLKDNCIDLIVTSPPYASHAIDYMRAHKFSLVWFGYSVSHLSELRRNYAGGHSITDSRLLPLPKHASKIVRSISHVDKKKSLVLHRYYSEMTQMLSEMHRVLKPGRAAIVVVGSSKMRNLDVETHKCLGEIGKEIGFDLVHIGTRRLDRDRRMMPARWNRNGDNNIESRMHEEFVLGFLKPTE